MAMDFMKSLRALLMKAGLVSPEIPKRPTTKGSFKLPPKAPTYDRKSSDEWVPPPTSSVPYTPPPPPPWVKFAPPWVPPEPEGYAGPSGDPYQTVKGPKENQPKVK